MASLVSSLVGGARRSVSSSADISQVRKTFFNPLLSNKTAIIEFLSDLPIGSAHPYSPERIILLRTRNGVREIDISQYPEDYFFNAIDLDEMGEVLLGRMARFNHLKIFEDFQIQQAPASTFRIPLVANQITILAVSERKPTYYDFCFADDSSNICCYSATNTFAGLNHSGDILAGNNDFLAYVTIDPNMFAHKDLCVFISGYNYTPITRFLGTHPALLVANHVEKVLYIVPVPLDEATIGQATLCCPLVVRRERKSLLCSILPTATTDVSKMASGAKLSSPCFREALTRADFTISDSADVMEVNSNSAAIMSDASIAQKKTTTSSVAITKKNAIFVTTKVTLPESLDSADSQIIEFGTGLNFKNSQASTNTANSTSTVVLPCIFGTQLEGPLLLATGTTPENVPFTTEKALLEFYTSLKSVTVFVDDRMTDNARNLASSWRMNAVYVLQLKPETEPQTQAQVLDMLDSANINTVTALAGPQSLVLVQVSDKYYFYRGLANREYLNTSSLSFGTDVSGIVNASGLESLVEPRAQRIVNLSKSNTILLPKSGQTLDATNLKQMFQQLPVEDLVGMVEDISAAVPQLQILLKEKDLADLSNTLVSVLATKVSTIVTPLRDEYVSFLKNDFKPGSPELVHKKERLLGEFRKKTLRTQKALEPVITGLANMMSVQNTSKRTYDLKRLVRKAQIANNVEATKNMTFDTLAGYLETHAMEMGIMLCNINAGPYSQLLGSLRSVQPGETKSLATIDASASCELDSRVLHLEGFDAGIILEQSQAQHDGPLARQAGSTMPTLALPYLSQGRGLGSMISWVCWDEFVNLESPYSVRWMEKCNDPHIAAIRIITRSTLANAVASRQYDFQPSNPEIGNLMSALLMSAMTKLAAMRTSVPIVQAQAEDTVIKLMRGLFGNLLTIAGSGSRPLSAVFQLFGTDPQFDVPSSAAEWMWYEKAVALYAYTGWPIKQFLTNLERLLDKAIIRVVTKGEDTAKMKTNRTAELIEYCRLRNIQLDHSRTIITILMKMLTSGDAKGLPSTAKRLLANVPKTLERKTQSYTRMIKYLDELSKGRGRQQANDALIASVYTKRSAAFGKCKTLISEAACLENWDKAHKYIQALLDEHARLAELWSISVESFEVQNIQPYKDFLAIDTQSEDPAMQKKLADLVKRIRSDAERDRVAWQVGKKGQFGEAIEPLDEGFVHEMLTGEKYAHPAKKIFALEDFTPADEATVLQTEVVPVPTKDPFLAFASSLRPGFVKTMQSIETVGDVTSLLVIPERTLRVFATALNQDFDFDQDLVSNFRTVILDLLKSRSDRVESRAAMKLFGGLEGDVVELSIEDM